jgi:SAM-dependent methyltransferase
MIARWLQRAFARPSEQVEVPRVDDRRADVLVEDVFCSGAYLQEYYSTLGHENAEVGNFLLGCAKSLLPTGSLKVLDAGCGPTILYWSAFLPGVNEVHGFDINPVNIAENKRRMAEVQCGVADAGLLEAAEHAMDKMGARASARSHLADKVRQVASLRVADLTEVWPYAEGQFDFVMSCFALEQLPDWAAFDVALGQASRVLRKGGSLALVAGSQGTHWLCDNQSFPTLFVLPDDLRVRLERVGLQVGTMREVDSTDTNWRDQGYSKVLLTQATK